MIFIRASHEARVDHSMTYVSVLQMCVLFVLRRRRTADDMEAIGTP